MMSMDNSKQSIVKFAWYATLAMTILTLITWGFAMLAVPPSGPYCPDNCMEYPFSGLLEYYPRDYNWMYLAVFQLFAFMIFSIFLHHNAPNEKKIFSSTGVVFAIISTTVLLSAYFIQFAVVPMSMMKGETEGIALLTQYNGHGIFIALEELGYITMSISLFFFFPIFAPANGLNKAIRWVLLLPVVLNILAFIYYSLQFGLDRSYRFEVAAISIDWLALIAGGILISIYFKRLIRNK